MIDKILLSPLKIIPVEAGDVFHVMKASDIGFVGFGEAYFSSIKKGQIKGWKRHKKMTLNLVVPCGEIRFILYDDRPDSITCGKFSEVSLSTDNYQRLTVPPMIWMAFQGVRDDLNLVVNIASIPHDSQEVENLELDELNYKW